MRDEEIETDRIVNEKSLIIVYNKLYGWKTSTISVCLRL